MPLDADAHLRNKGTMQGAAEGLGDIATGTLIAREVERAQAGEPALGHAVHEPCANCGMVRCGPYCHQCGQAGHVHRSLGALVHDIAHGVFHFEGKFWSTLPLLGWRPGELTRRYVHGERAKFVSPMALFLFSVFLMFAIVPHLAGGHHGDLGTQLSAAQKLGQERTKLAQLQAERARATDPGRQKALDAQIDDARSGVSLLEKITSTGVVASGTPVNLKSDDIHTGVPAIDKAINHAAENPQLLLYKLKMNAYKYSWALIPISLPFIWLLFAFRPGVGLYDHAIFSIYSLSFMSLATVALVVLGKIGLPSAIIVLAVMIVPPVHMYRQLKGAYLLGRFAALWRTVALLFITVITSSLFFTMLLYMGTE